MAKSHGARYSVTYGLAGCYMYDSYDGAWEFNCRKELAEHIREAMALYDVPKRRFREVNLRRLWGFIKHHGSSTAHFHIRHGAYVLSFHGLTEGEFREQTSED